MAKTDGIFILAATYPDEAAAQEDYQVVKDLHAGGLVGSYDAAVVTKDAKGKVHLNKDETATRHGHHQDRRRQDQQRIMRDRVRGIDKSDLVRVRGHPTNPGEWLLS